MSVSIVPASDFQLPEPEIISHQTDLTMRRTEVRAFSEAQMRAAYAAGIEAGQATTKPRKSRATKADALRPSDVPEGTWTDFIALRKAKGAPLTETALKLIVKDAEKAGYTLTAALEICCARGWQAFRADWVAPRPSARGGSLAGMNYGDRHGDFNQ